jgi:GT2 family glycosyltransferase
MPETKVYILIPVHNRRATTLKCLQALDRNGDLQRYTVVVIDDGSTDGTATAIRSQYPMVTILPGTGDLWWTGAIAKGMHHAAREKADQIFWLNDDCHPEPGCLSLLVQFLQDHPGAIAAPTCAISATGAVVETGCRGRRRLVAAPGKVVQVDNLSGYCVGMSIAVYHRLGTPNPKRFPHYSGDDVYTMQANREGFPIYLLGDARATLHDLAAPEYGFTAHITARFGGSPSFSMVFLTKKSRCYLPTQFFYHIAKYGHCLGVPLFLLKFSGWLCKYVAVSAFRKRLPGNS